MNNYMLIKVDNRQVHRTKTAKTTQEEIGNMNRSCNK